MKKNVIKRVEFRKEIDLRSVEGLGGDKITEKIKEKYSEKKHNDIRKKIDTIYIQKTKREKYKEFPVIIETKLINEALSKTSKKAIHEIFKHENFISLIDKNTMIYKLKEEEVKKLKKEIDSSKKVVQIIASMEEIKEYEPQINPDLKNAEKIKIKLIEQKNEKLEKIQEEILFEVLKDFEIKTLELLNGKKYYEVENNRDFNKILELRKLPFIESIKEVVQITIDYDEDFFDKPSIPIYDNKKDYPLVGLFDSGVNKKIFKEWCLDQHSNYLEDEVDYNHGSKVGSIICFGDKLNDNNLGVEGCNIVSCVIGAKKKISESELIIALEESLKKYSNKIKIWNLSLSGNKEVPLDRFSDFAIQLDILQKKYNVLFVKSTGNCEEYENSRINCGAESLRALTVGSISPGGENWTSKDKLSNFSKIGKDLTYIKPEIVYYGGDEQKTGEKCTIKSFNKNGNLCGVLGTSFSTPYISSYAANIYKMLKGQEFDPLLIKGLIIHNTTYGNIDKKDKQKIDKFGYGIPKNIEEIFYEDDKQITLIFRGKIEKGKFYETLDIPFPENLIKDGYYTGEIILTALIDPILEGNQGLEYSQVDYEIIYGLYNNKCLGDLSKRYIKNELRTDTKLNILKTDKKVSKENESHIKKYKIDLNKTFPKSKEKLSSNKKWCLKIKPTYKLFIDEELKNLEKPLEIDYCILLTIKSKEQDINRDMLKKLELENYNPIDLEVRVEDVVEEEINI